MNLDLSADYLIYDNLQTITYFPRTTEALSSTSQTVNNALAVYTPRQLSGGMKENQAQNWHVWQPELSGISPVAGDVVQDGNGIRWSVKSVNYTYLTGRYELTTQRERVNTAGSVIVSTRLDFSVSANSQYAGVF